MDHRRAARPSQHIRRAQARTRSPSRSGKSSSATGLPTGVRLDALAWGLAGWRIQAAKSRDPEVPNLQDILRIAGNGNRTPQEVATMSRFLLDLLGVAPQTRRDSIADAAAHLRLCTYPENAIIARQGGQGFRYHVLLQGSVGVYVNTSNVQTSSLGRMLGSIGYGACFGDCGLAGMPYTASFKCLRRTAVLEIDSGMVLSAAPHRHLAMDPETLAIFPVLAAQHPSLINLLAASLKTVRFRPGETIVFQGPMQKREEPAVFFIVEGVAGVFVDPVPSSNGRVQVDPAHLVPLPTIGPGTVVGEEALLTDCNFSHVVAISDVRAHWISKSQFIKQAPPSLMAAMSRAARRKAEQVPDQVQAAVDALAVARAEEEHARAEAEQLEIVREEQQTLIREHLMPRGADKAQTSTGTTHQHEQHRSRHGAQRRGHGREKPSKHRINDQRQSKGMGLSPGAHQSPGSDASFWTWSTSGSAELEASKAVTGLPGISERPSTPVTVDMPHLRIRFRRPSSPVRQVLEPQSSSKLPGLALGNVILDHKLMSSQLQNSRHRAAPTLQKERSHPSLQRCVPSSHRSSDSRGLCYEGVDRRTNSRGMRRRSESPEPWQQPAASTTLPSIERTESSAGGGPVRPLSQTGLSRPSQ